MSGESSDWDRVFDGYQAAVDYPASIFWEELSQVYPDAKIILTVRDPKRWHASVRDAFPNVSEMDYEDVPEVLKRLGDLLPLMSNAAQERLGLEWEPGKALTEEQAVDAFNTHVERVRANAPADRLLVFSAGDGWGPLCDFLGVEAPVDEPFPHLNDTETMQRMFAGSKESGKLVTPFTT